MPSRFPRTLVSLPMFPAPSLWRQFLRHQHPTHLWSNSSPANLPLPTHLRARPQRLKPHNLARPRDHLPRLQSRSCISIHRSPSRSHVRPAPLLLQLLSLRSPTDKSKRQHLRSARRPPTYPRTSLFLKLPSSTTTLRVSVSSKVPLLPPLERQAQRRLHLLLVPHLLAQARPLPRPRLQPLHLTQAATQRRHVRAQSCSLSSLLLLVWLSSLDRIVCHHHYCNVTYAPYASRISIMYLWRGKQRRSNCLPLVERGRASAGACLLLCIG